MADRDVPTPRLRTLTVADLDVIADVHRAAFHDAMLTLLGHGAVRRYYEWQLMGPHDVLALGGELDGRFAGFCFAGLFKGAMRGYVRKNLAYLVLRMLASPRAWVHPDIIGRARTVRVALRRQHPIEGTKAQQNASSRCYSVLSISVDPAFRRSGIGQALLVEVERVARDRGFPCMNLTVAPSNAGAIAFYESQGWAKQDGDAFSGAMRKTLI